jgi:serine protease
MAVNWKKGVLFPALFLLFLILYGCSNAPKPSIRGALLFVSGDSALKGLTASGIPLQAKGAPAPGAGTAGDQTRARAIGPPVTDFVPDQIIVKYRPGVEPDRLAKGVVSLRYAEVRSDRNISRGALTLMKLAGTARGVSSAKTLRGMTLSEIDRLRANPYVEYAEPNYIYKTAFVPNDANYPYQWHYPLIRLDSVWDDGALPAGLQDLSAITVAVIDTGIVRITNPTPPPDRLVHPDLTDTPTLFRDEYDFCGDTIDDPDDHDGDATDPLTSTFFHGTHVTGTIAALTNNGPDIQYAVAGVAGGNLADNRHGVRIMPLRALSNGVGTVYDITQAVLYAAGLANAYASPPASKAQVINMSIGGYLASAALAGAIKSAYDAGLVIVAAAGNENDDSPFYPASYPEVISVAAVTVGAEKAPYSNFGSAVDIAAPGGSGITELKLDMNFDLNPDDVLSTFFDGGFTTAYAAGTSMAAPHAAGAAALVLRALTLASDPEKSPARVKYFLTSTAVDLGFPEFFGAGLLNVYAAVTSALGSSEAQPVLCASPKTVRLYGSPPSGTFVLKNIGNGQNVVVESIDVIDATDPGFIQSITPSAGTVGPGGLSVTVTADSGYADWGLHPEINYAMIEVSYSGGKKEHVYALTKATGTVYVVAMDRTMTNILATTTANPEDGFAFSFPSLKEGYYVIGASTDRNGNGVIFGDPDADEAYGFYPSFDSPAPLALDAGDELELNIQVMDWE